MIKKLILLIREKIYFNKIYRLKKFLRLERKLTIQKITGAKYAGYYLKNKALYLNKNTVSNITSWDSNNYIYDNVEKLHIIKEPDSF